jgi:hypothetical protein
MLFANISPRTSKVTELAPRNQAQVRARFLQVVKIFVVEFCEQREHAQLIASEHAGPYRSTRPDGRLFVPFATARDRQRSWSGNESLDC